MKHDPEQAAAAYLGGLLTSRKRRLFEAHIVECEDCWRQVDLGRRGRAAAESARELAPQALRERVRAAVETAAVPPPRRRWVLVGSVVSIVLSTGALVLLAVDPGREPMLIRAVASSFVDDRAIGPETDPSLPRRLGDLSLIQAEVGQLEGVSVDVHRYADGAGHRVSVYRADREWPVPPEAEEDEASNTWIAALDGIVIFCSNDPAPYLVVGDDQQEVGSAARALGLG